MTQEEYLLTCLAEECAEVTQRVTKALRFGLTEIQATNPEETRNNRERIKYELSDLLTVVQMLETLGPEYGYFRAKPNTEKWEKLRKYMAYSQNLGRLQCEALP